ncbi:MAG: hypothetical protein ABIN58_04195 [candidate division WOR-3 bacterium]
MAKTPPGTVKESGAVAGSILVGVKEHNAGLTIKVHEPQPHGKGGRIIGPFELLVAGTGTYAIHLRPHEGKIFRSVEELLDTIRRHRGAEKATHILNRNCLEMLARDGESGSSFRRRLTCILNRKRAGGGDSPSLRSFRRSV